MLALLLGKLVLQHYKALLKIDAEAAIKAVIFSSNSTYMFRTTYCI